MKLYTFIEFDFGRIFDGLKTCDKLLFNPFVTLIA